MRKALFCLVLIVFLTQAWSAVTAAESQHGLIPPPPIYVPYGGKIVTEVNLSDSDVLGIVKQVLPSLGEVIGALAPMAAAAPGLGRANAGAAAASMVGQIDFKGLAQAIDGIKNVRFIAASYAVGIAPDAMQGQLDAGVAKAGRFSRVVSDTAFTPGVFSLYAEPNNAGYMGFMYDPGSRMLYGVRIVGFVDMAKLTQWAVDAAKLLSVRVPAPVQVTPPAVQPTPEPALEPDTSSDASQPEAAE